MFDNFCQQQWCGRRAQSSCIGSGPKVLQPLKATECYQAASEVALLLNQHPQPKSPTTLESHSMFDNFCQQQWCGRRAQSSCIGSGPNVLQPLKATECYQAASEVALLLNQHPQPKSPTTLESHRMLSSCIGSGSASQSASPAQKSYNP